MLLNWLYLLAALTPSALADVKFTTPAAGASVPAGGTFAVEWKDSGTAPSVSDLASYQLFLCAGGNDAVNFVRVLPMPPMLERLEVHLQEPSLMDALLADSIGSNHDTRFFRYGK